jgi:hypothetical protein
MFYVILSANFPVVVLYITIQIGIKFSVIILSVMVLFHLKISQYNIYVILSFNILTLMLRITMESVLRFCVIILCAMVPFYQFRSFSALM